MSKDVDPVSRRCSLCSIDWPDLKAYNICPECLDPDGTSRIRNIKPLPEDEAWTKKLYADFERFYEEWDAERDPDRLRADAPDIVVV